MAATDYVIVTGWMNAYLTKKKKPPKKGPQTMSKDRRPITEGEMIGLLEFSTPTRQGSKPTAPNCG